MMSNLFHKSFMALSAGAFLLAGTAVVTAASVSPVWAQDEEEEENKSLSATVAKEVQAAYQLATEEERFAEAIAKLDQLLAQRQNSMTAYEKATVYELRASFRANMDNPDFNLILRDLEAAVAQGALGAERERQIRFNIAKIYFQEERYDEAIRLLEEYVAYQQSIGDPVNADTWYLIGAANVALERFSNARRPMENALNLNRQSGKPNKSYYGLMNFIYSEIGASSERGDLLVEMINLWPEEEGYWAQLAGAYSAADREADAAAVLELAYRAGIITDEPKILNLAQYLTVLDNPYRAAQLLEKELAAGNIERSQSNLMLLAQAYNLAREQKKALVPLREAANMAPTGELYYRLGQIYFADEQWQEAINAMNQAINRGGLDSNDIGDAWLLIGNAQYNIDTNSAEQRRLAMEAWRRATNYSGSRSTANGWITYLQQVIATEQRQDAVERLQREEAFKGERKRCQTNLEIFERLGGASGFAEEDAERCERILEGKWEAGKIVFPDGSSVSSIEEV